MIVTPLALESGLAGFMAAIMTTAAFVPQAAQAPPVIASNVVNLRSQGSILFLKLRHG
ncbi:MAG: hypothetical protein ACR650_03770 [Methylocystis sp.]